MANASVRFDGIYWSPDGAPDYLRFYADGAVVSVSSPGTPDQISKWISRSTDTPSHYSIDGDRIAFDFWIERGEDGMVGGAIRYAGSIDGDRLVLRVTSEVTGYNATRTYAFFPATLAD